MFTGMTGDRARSALGGSRFADLRWVEVTGSTNADLVAEARAGGRDGTVLVADHQTAGRGRLGRAWVAPPSGSLLFSVLLRPTMPADDLHLLTTALGLAGVQAVAECAGVQAGIKWPNDLVVGTPAGERKLAGILAESVVEGDQVVGVVIGMGLNVAWGGEAPEEVADIAVALDGLGAADVDREDLLAAILVGFDARLRSVEEPAARAELAAEHVARCVTLGRDVRVELADGVLEGRAVTIDHHGRLVVERDGSPVAVDAGDVVHLR
jgi:BirA family biotin operon repressor/biotin-[acetyl-CoA-carboxylase] ligase